MKKKQAKNWTRNVIYVSIFQVFHPTDVDVRGVQMIHFFYELGTPSNCQRGRSAMPRVLLRSQVWFLDTMLIMHQPTNWKPAFIFFLFLSERYDQNNDPKKNKSNHNLSLKKKEEKIPAFIFFARAVQIPGLIFRSKTVNLSGASQKCHFPHSSSKTPDLCMESNFCNIFWWVANWAIKPCSMFLSLQHCLRQISPWSGTTILYELSVEKLVLLSFRGYLGEIESEKNKP